MKIKYWIEDFTSDTLGKIVFLAIILIVILLIYEVVMSIEYSLTTPIEIDAREIKNYVGKKVKCNVTAVQQLSDMSEFAYFIPLFIYTGKTTNVIYIPVYKHHNVYKCKEGIIVIIEKPGTLPLNQTVTIIGEVELHEEKYIIIVH